MPIFRITRDPEQWFGEHRRVSMSRSGLWAGLQTGTQGGFQFIGAVVLSRLVAPEEFGLLALVFVFYSISAELLNQSLGSASVQKATLSAQQASNVFWINIILSAGAAVLIAGAGPLLARFYDDSRLVPLAVVMGGLLVLDGVFAQHKALIMRARRFDILFLSTLVTGVAGLAVGVILAWRGFGVWALVAQLAVTSVFGRACLFFFVPWVPGRLERYTGIRSMLRFGGLVGLGRMVGFVQSRLVVLVLGAVATPAAVGFLNRGQSLLQRPLEQILGPLGMTLLPSMSSLQNHRRALENLVVKVYWTFALLAGGLLCWILVSGPGIAVLLLGEPWHEAGRVMQWLALAGFVQLLSVPLGRANAACGRPARTLSVQLIALPPFLLALFHFAPRGAAAAAAVMAVTQVLKYSPAIYLALRGLGVKRSRIVRNIAAIVTVATATWAALFFLPIPEEGARFLALRLLAAYVLFSSLAMGFSEGRTVLRWGMATFRTNVLSPLHARLQSAA